jgi:Ca2+-binding EF-hand superfamily protein
MMNLRFLIVIAAAIFALALPVSAQTALAYNIDPFFSTLDTNKDGFITKQEWQGMNLMEVAFSLCDANKDEKISKPEMAASAIPEAMDPKKEGIVTVFGISSFVIPANGVQIPKPAKFAPGISQVTQFVANSPYVEGGPTGEAFIKLLDQDGDGKISHSEWEAVKNNTVFKPFRWPQYNRNRDDFITLDEAPKPPVK